MALTRLRPLAATSPIEALITTDAAKPSSSFVRIFIVDVSPGGKRLRRDLHLHLHLRVDRAVDVRLADRVELDLARLADLLRAQVERHPRRLRVDVVGDAVLVREGDGLTLLHGDFGLGELLVLLVHRHALGVRRGGDEGEGAGGKKSFLHDVLPLTEEFRSWVQRCAVCAPPPEKSTGMRTGEFSPVRVSMKATRSFFSSSVSASFFISSARLGRSTKPWS